MYQRIELLQNLLQNIPPQTDLLAQGRLLWSKVDTVGGRRRLRLSTVQ